MPSITTPSATRNYNPRMPFLLTPPYIKPLDNNSKESKNMNTNNTNNTYYS